MQAAGAPALFVAGTGLYLTAVIDALQLPGEWPEVRAELQAEADTAALFARLQQLDPLAASRCEPSNRRRIERALEVTIGSGKPFSSFGPHLEGHRCASVGGVQEVWAALTDAWITNAHALARTNARRFMRWRVTPGSAK